MDRASRPPERSLIPTPATPTTTTTSQPSPPLDPPSPSPPYHHTTLTNGAYKHLILQDIFLITIVATVLGIGIYQYLHRRGHTAYWIPLGHVRTNFVHPTDLLWISGIILFYSFTILLPYQAPDPDREITVLDIAVSGLIGQFFIAFIACLPIALRGFSLNHQFKLRQAKIIPIAVTILIAFLAILAFSAFLQLIGYEAWMTERIGPRTNQAVVDSMMSSSGALKITLVIFACFIAPICEEIIFRGYVYPVLKRWTDPLFAVLIVSIIFGLIHNELWAFPVLTFLGILLVVAYECTGSLLAPIILHALFNGMSTFFMLNPDLIEQIEQMKQTTSYLLS